MSREGLQPLGIEKENKQQSSTVVGLLIDIFLCLTNEKVTREVTKNYRKVSQWRISIYEFIRLCYREKTKVIVQIFCAHCM